MYRQFVVVEQIGSPIRRSARQRKTLIGLKLNKIGRTAELPANDSTRGMLARVRHLVRIIGWTAKLDEKFIAAATDNYKKLVIERVENGTVLWSNFENAVAACIADPKRDGRQVVEFINELAVAKRLCEDKSITGAIRYEPKFLPSGRKIDFIVDRGRDNIYIEVKTVHPRTGDTEKSWQNFIARRIHHPKNVNVMLEKEWMGGAIYGNLFASRSHFLEYTRDFEERLAEAKEIKNGPGLLIFCGTGFVWHKSNLEDFADFYRTGEHRDDDPFALMEKHFIETKKIQLLRNIDHFGLLKRHLEDPGTGELFFPIRGPQFVIPPPKPL